MNTSLKLVWNSFQNTYVNQNKIDPSLRKKYIYHYTNHCYVFKNKTTDRWIRWEGYCFIPYCCPYAKILMYNYNSFFKHIFFEFFEVGKFKLIYIYIYKIIWYVDWGRVIFSHFIFAQPLDLVRFYCDDSSIFRLEAYISSEGETTSSWLIDYYEQIALHVYDAVYYVGLWKS